MIFQRHSIAFKITVLILVGTGVVFALTAVQSYLSSRQIILRETETSSRNLTQSVANRVEQEFRRVEKVVQNLSYYLESTSGQTMNLNEVMTILVEKNNEIYGMAIAYERYAYDSSREWFAPYYFKAKTGVQSVPLEPPNYHYDQQDWYHIPSVLKEPVWSEPYFDAGGGNVMMTTYSLPFFEPGKERKLKGVITADVSLGWLTRLVSSIAIKRSGYCFLISGTGKFITYPRTDFVLRESVFSIASEMKRPELRSIGRELIHQRSGFLDLGTNLSADDSYLAHARIPSTGWSLNAVFPKDELFEEIDQLYLTTLISSALGGLLLMTVSLLVARSIARPLRRMSQATQRVAEGDLNIDLSDIRSRDEVGNLAQAFMHMTNGLKQRDFIRDTFGRYLTKEVVNRLLETKDGLQLGGESRELTVMMSDIRGFTQVTANMDPEQVITFLNRYLSKIVEILIDYQGTIDEIVGDGILAFFGAPEVLEDHAARAVACALQMQVAMEDINQLNEKEGLPHIEIGVAINTARVVVGNIGSEKRSKYAAVGPGMNFTGRMESYTVGGQVLVSPSTYERLSNILQVKKTIEVEMKGMAEKVVLYDVIGIGGSYNVHLHSIQDAPLPLKEPITVRFHRLTEKMVTDSSFSGRISHASLVSAILITTEDLEQWENLKIQMLDADSNALPGDVYAKVVSVAHNDSATEAFIRFTSIPKEGYLRLKDLLQNEI
jgi:sigma-B regulation protein RsbU (phosphoserine phosphatase)